MILLAALLLTAPSPTVDATSGTLICQVQRRLQRRRPWTQARCDRVAEAMRATTFAPDLMLVIAILESGLRAKVKACPQDDVCDVGLMGIRCRLVHGRCINWPVRGYPLRRLYDPVINIQAAERLLQRKRQRSPRHWLRHYNGGTREHGYATSVRVLRAAVSGRRLHAPTPRVRGIARLLIDIAREEQHERSDERKRGEVVDQS